jgi:hypothetical protein
MSEQTPLSEALTSAAEHASVMAERLHKAVHLLAEQITTCVAPAIGDQLGQFTHTDDYGDTVVFDRTGRSGRFMVETTEDHEVVLDQDAVNRLAQYLDRHRTDTQCETDFGGEQCAGTRDHRGECSPDLSEPCAGHSPDGPPDLRGCGHRKGGHGVAGCMTLGCPCERRNGQ